MAFDVNAVRRQFPAFEQLDHGRTPIFLDNPAGTQVPQQVIDAVVDYYRKHNANSGGVFATSQRTDEMKHSARKTLAAFLNATHPEEISFSANMTTHTLNFSRAIGKNFQPGDEIILTQMDHDANVNPWLRMAQDRDLTVRWVRLDVEEGTLDLKSYENALNEKTKLVCAAYAANSLGTINPIKQMTVQAHAVGAQVFVDAVQAAPHLLIDVQDFDIDYLVCSAYKFYGPHIGVLYGKYDLMEAIHPYKVRPAKDKMPDKWETGTGSYETIAGTKAAIDYLASFGNGGSLRQRLQSSYQQIMAHEQQLIWQLIDGLKAIPGIEIRGIVDESRAEERVPTVIFRLADRHPDDVAAALAKEAIYAWSGDYYAVEVMSALGHVEDGGMVRLGIAHYNTADEIDRTLEILSGI
jgi:cysteine desulfurase family protein (TIGR01976 family)